MKKSLLALAVLGAFAGAASAQSSVTIYGNIQLGIQKYSGTDPIMDVAPGYNQVGFRGNEVLSPDLSAIFDLQLRFSPESGGNDGTFNGSGAAADQNRGPFQGKTVVGFASKSMGTLTFGRQLTPMSVYSPNADAVTYLGHGGMAASNDLLALGWYADPTPGGVRSNAGLARTDMIHYMSPNWSGFSFVGAYGLKRSGASGTPLLQQKNFRSLYVNFATGPFYIGAGQEVNRRGDKVTAIAGSYDLKVVKFRAGYATLDTKDGAPPVVSTVTGGTVFSSVTGPKSKRTVVSASVPLGAFTVAGGFGRVKAEGTGLTTVQRVGLGVSYALSPRTSVFTGYGHSKNKATNTTSKGADLSLRHTF